MSATPRSDIRLASDVWESVMTAHATLNGIFASEDMWGEVSMREYDVLYTLAKGQGPMRICDVQSGILLSQPALSRMLDRLAQRGLVAREVDQEDKRAVLVTLTEDGARVQREVGRAHAKSINRELGAALSPEDMHELMRICTALVER